MKGNIGDFFYIKGGKRLPKGSSFASDKTEHPYLRVTDFIQNGLKTDSIKYISPEIQNQIKRYTIEANSVYISIAGTIGIAGIVPPELNGANLTENAAKFVPKEGIEVHSKYLSYYLNSAEIQGQIESKTMAVGVPKLALFRIQDIPIVLPPLSTQKKIAQILDQADALRKKTQQIIEQYDKLAQSIFWDMFGDPFINPKKWEWTTISEITTLIKGITYNPSQKNIDGALVLRSSNIKNGQLDLFDQVRVSKKINNKFWVKQNDILMCNRNGSPHLVGKVAKIPQHNENMTFGTFMTNIRSKYYNYLYYFFHTEAFRRQIQMQTTVAINQISLPLLERVRVPLPPNDLQLEFGDKIHSIENQKAKAQESLQQSEDLFNSLLQKAFKGELVK